ncbi:MAG: hypothetical protein LLG14_19565 [Nocardiaceae bacterium]|nr:hypothetical protein [Nocardiaceae bacterium]
MRPSLREFVNIGDGEPPMLVSLEVIGAPHYLSGTDELLQILLRMHSEKAHEREAQIRNRASSAPSAYLPNLNFLASMTGQSVRTEPMSDEDLAAEIAAYEAALDERWPSCMDYLAGTALPGLQFKIENRAKSFLKNVEIIVTFEGAVGVEKLPIEDFRLERLEDPAWEPSNPFGVPSLSLSPIFRHVNSELTWRNNEDGALEVTIRLDEIRPHPPKVVGDDEVVLVVPARVEAIAVTWTGTAEPFGEVHEGDPTRLSVVTTPARELVRAALQKQVAPSTERS